MAPSQRALDFAAVCAESLLIGAYAVLTALVIWLMVHKGKRMPTMHMILFCASVVMFCISIVHISLVMVQIVTQKLSQANARTRIVLSVLQFMIGDLVLVWRVWVVWGHNYWVAAGPLAIMIAASALTLNLLGGHQTGSFFTVAPTALIVSNTSICTLLIAGKIWYSRYQLRQVTQGAMYSKGGFSGTVALFIESGALYAGTQLLSLILDHVKSPAIHIVLDLEIPLIGILPTLIIVLVHFHLVGNSNDSIPTRSIRFGESNTLNLGTISSATVQEPETSFQQPLKNTKSSEIMV